MVQKLSIRKFVCLCNYKTKDTSRQGLLPEINREIPYYFYRLI